MAHQRLINHNGWHDKDETWHEKNVRLWEETRDPAAMLEANMKLVGRIVGRHMRKTKTQYMEEELMQAACEGFLKVFKRKEWNTQYALATFVGWDMIAAMQQAQRRAIHSFGTVSHSVTQGSEKVRDVMPRTVSLNLKTGRHADESSEIVDFVGRPEAGYDLVDGTATVGRDVRRWAEALTSEKRQWFYDWLEIFIEDDVGATRACAERWGVTRQAAETRIRRMLEDIRAEYPDEVMGSISLRPDMRGLANKERYSQK